MESAPLIFVDHGDTKRGNQANAKCANDAAHGDSQAFAIDGREHLASENTPNDSPAYLHDNVEYTSQL